MPSLSPIETPLRKAIEDSGLTAYALGKATGIPIPTIHRFLKDGRDLRLSNAEKIAAVLNLELQPKPHPKKKD